jgi:hypothetical protein
MTGKVNLKKNGGKSCNIKKKTTLEILEEALIKISTTLLI